MSLPSCIIDAGTVIEDFTDTTDWTKDSTVGTLQAHFRCLDDTDKSGVAAYLNVTASPAVGRIWRTDKSIDMSAMNTLTLDFQYFTSSDIVTYGVKLKLEVSSTTDFSKSYISNEVLAPSDYCVGGLRLTFHKDDFTASGGESWSNTMVAIRFHMTPQGTGYGWSMQPRIYLDKIVMDRQVRPMVLLSAIVSSVAASRVSWLGYMAEYGWYDGKVSASIDYNSVGEAGNSTWPELKAADDYGLRLYPNMTPWFMKGSDNVEQTVPPYPAYDATYDAWGDNTGSQLMSEWHLWEVLRRAKVCHDYYSIPWRMGSVFCHATNMNTVDGRRWVDQSGFTLYRANGGWTAAGKYIQYMSCPVAKQTWWMPVYATDVSHSNVLAAIDQCVDSGRYLALRYYPIGSGVGYWPQADLEAELDAIKTYENQGLLDVINIETFIARAQSWTGGKMALPAPAAVNSVALGAIDLNDGVNYFVDAEGFNVSQKQTTWDEIPSYSAEVNAQVNVSTKALVPVTIPMRVSGSSVPDLDTKLEALWVEVDKPSNTLTIGDDESYDIIYSTRPGTIERDQMYQTMFNARFTLILMREP